MRKADAYQRYLAGMITESAYIAEAMVSDEGLESLIREYHRLTEELTAIKRDLEERESRSKEIVAQIAPLLEAIEGTEDRTLQVDDIVVSIKKKGSVYDRPHYQKVYEELFQQVDESLQRIMEGLKEAHKTVVRQSTTLSVQRLEHGILSAAGMLSAAWRRILSMIGVENGEIDRALSEFRDKSAV